MDDESISGIERAVFGAVSREEIDVWLRKHLRARLGHEPSNVIFRSGRLAAVYGAELDDGHQVAVKVHRRPVDLAYLAAAATCQRRLADAGYPCPEPLDGPATTDGQTAMVETLLDHAQRGDGHEPATRQAMAHSLHTQVEHLRGWPADDLREGAPAWSHYEHGPWPTPHDPIFDFSATPPGLTWLDDLAQRAAEIMVQAGPPDVIAHVDWNCANVRFHGGEVGAAYDWDSIAAGPEPVLIGLSAGAFTSGSTAGDNAPAPAEVRAFLRDYDALRAQPFTGIEQAAATAAATWVMAYNARCGASVLPAGGEPPPGSPLRAIMTYRGAYLDLRW